MITQFLLVPVMGFVDSLCGGRPQVPGRGEYYAVPALILFSHFILNWAWMPAVIFGALYWAYRACKPDQFGGSLNPQTQKEIVGTFIKHSLALALIIPIVMAGISIDLTFIPLLMYPFLATFIAMDYTKKIEKTGVDKNYNNYEAFRGIILGLTLAIAIS